MSEESVKEKKEREAKAADVRSRYPDNRAGRRAAEREIIKLGLR